MVGSLAEDCAFPSSRLCGSVHRLIARQAGKHFWLKTDFNLWKDEVRT